MKITRMTMALLFSVGMFLGALLTNPEHLYVPSEVVVRPWPKLMVHVGRFGAHPDDHALDVRGVQAAIDYVGKRGGGVVCFAAGRYLFPDEEPLDFRNYHDVTLEGRKSGGTEWQTGHWVHGRFLYEFNRDGCKE